MPPSWTRRVVVTATAAAGALCAAGTVTAGPVPAVGGGVCMPWPDTELAAVASPMINDGPAPITVTQVALRDAYGVAIETAALAPHHMYPDGGGLAFGFGTYPPLEPELVDEWDRRVDAAGGEVPPGETVSLVIGLRRTSDTPTATLGGFDVVYTDAGRSHHVAMEWDIVIHSDGRSCG